MITWCKSLKSAIESDSKWKTSIPFPSSNARSLNEAIYRKASLGSISKSSSFASISSSICGSEDNMYAATIRIILPLSQITIMIYLITVMLFFAGFFEAASIALVLPFISLLIDKEQIINLPYIKNILPNISEYSNETLIISSLVIFLLFYFFKFFYLIFVIKYKNKVLFL